MRLYRPQAETQKGLAKAAVRPSRGTWLTWVSSAKVHGRHTADWVKPLSSATGDLGGLLTGMCDLSLIHRLGVF